MSQETPYFGRAYDYEIDPGFRPSYLKEGLREMLQRSGNKGHAEK